MKIGSIKENLSLLGVEHDNFIYESSLIENNQVQKTVNKLKENKYVYTGELPPPKGDLSKKEVRDILSENSEDLYDQNGNYLEE